MGVLAIIIREIRMGAMLFVMVRMLVLNVTLGRWGAEWEESNKSLPLVIMLVLSHLGSVARFAGTPA